MPLNIISIILISVKLNFHGKNLIDRKSNNETTAKLSRDEEISFRNDDCANNWIKTVQ